VQAKGEIKQQQQAENVEALIKALPKP